MDEKRRLETDARLLELAAELTRDGREDDAWELITVSSEYEDTVRHAIAKHFGERRARKEMRRILALAEGRLVRKLSWYVTKAGVGTERLAICDDPSAAHEVVKAWRDSDPRATVVRVTRIRRA